VRPARRAPTTPSSELKRKTRSSSTSRFTPAAAPSSPRMIHSTTNHRRRREISRYVSAFWISTGWAGEAETERRSFQMAKKKDSCNKNKSSPSPLALSLFVYSTIVSLRLIQLCCLYVRRLILIRTLPINPVVVCCGTQIRVRPPLLRSPFLSHLFLLPTACASRGQSADAIMDEDRSFLLTVVTITGTELRRT
jgi:hypothetical protein